jgi:hypothetical protein
MAELTPQEKIEHINELQDFCNEHGDKAVWTNHGYYRSDFIAKVVSELKMKVALQDFGAIEVFALEVLSESGHGYF